MKIQIFKLKEESSKKVVKRNELGFIKGELIEYDKNVDFYYTNIVNSLILFTYNAKQLDEMGPILIDPLTELYEELDYAFLPILFETVFRNKLIDETLKEELLAFKRKVDEIPVELWEWEFLEIDENWKQLRVNAEELLNKLEIDLKIYNQEIL